VAGYLWGLGYGDRGYGQSTPALTALTTGSVEQSWATLQAVLADLAAWQSTATTYLPTVAQLTAGAVNKAYPSGNIPSPITLLSALDTNRLNYVAGNMTLTSNAATSTRATAWGLGSSAAVASISCVMNVTFASEAAARLFFNTGGQIRIALAHPNTTTTLNSDWNSVLNNFVMGFSADATTIITGSKGTGSSIGYYELTTAYQTIVTANSIFSSPYASSSFSIQAQTVNVTGANGANGTQINFKITLTANDSNSSSYDVVALGTNAIMSHLRASAVLSTLPAAPACTVTTGF